MGAGRKMKGPAAQGGKGRERGEGGAGGGGGDGESQEGLVPPFSSLEGKGGGKLREQDQPGTQMKVRRSRPACVYARGRWPRLVALSAAGVALAFMSRAQGWAPPSREGLGSAGTQTVSCGFLGGLQRAGVSGEK